MPALSSFTVDPARESGDKLTRLGAEGFPDLAHDDEVDACSGALEMLNPPNAELGACEIARQNAEAIRAAQ